MTTMTRKQMAEAAGVSTRTLRRWLQPHEATLEAMGVRGKTMLTPKAVSWITEHFDIETDDY